MLGGFTTCTEMFGNGVRIGMARIGMATTRKKTWLTHKERTMANYVCCVVVHTLMILRLVARPIVAGLGLTTVATTSVAVSASSWSDFPHRQMLSPRRVSAPRRIQNYPARLAAEQGRFHSRKVVVPIHAVKSSLHS